MAPVTITVANRPVTVNFFHRGQVEKDAGALGGGRTACVAFAEARGVGLGIEDGGGRAIVKYVSRNLGVEIKKAEINRI